jgi:hypothetical protein
MLIQRYKVPTYMCDTNAFETVLFTVYCGAESPCSYYGICGTGSHPSAGGVISRGIHQSSNPRRVTHCPHHNRTETFLTHRIIYYIPIMYVFRTIYSNGIFFIFSFKGTVSRDFRPSVFFIKQSPLVP